VTERTREIEDDALGRGFTGEEKRRKEKERKEKIKGKGKQKKEIDRDKLSIF
jgi:hypothetical protein